MRLLKKVRDIELVPLPAVEQCCGFGGTFAIKNADVSGAMLEEKLQCLKTTQAEICTACDTSCLMHIEGALHRQQARMSTRHIARILADDASTAQRKDVP
jgi:L-lactate dehydrogenase complex protein LldE